MIPYQRQKRIIELLSKNNGLLSVSELVEQMDSVSESTIRRDLKKLEEEEQLEMLSGGGISLKSSLPDDEEGTQIAHLAEKKAIAQRAAQLVHDHETVYIDSGTTAFELYKILLTRDINIVTPSIKLNHELPRQIQARVFVLGGSLSFEKQSLRGEMALDNMDLFNFDRSFLGFDGVSPHYGFSIPTLEEAVIKQKVMKKSETSYFIGDSSKFHKKYMAKIADCKNKKLISDEINRDFADINFIS